MSTQRFTFIEEENINTMNTHPPQEILRGQEQRTKGVSYEQNCEFGEHLSNKQSGGKQIMMALWTKITTWGTT